MKMIKTETVIINEKEFKHTYSDSGFYIERDGLIYSDAMDPIDSDREYVETDKKIENETEK